MNMQHKVTRFDDNFGGQAYPFLPAEWEWKIVSRDFTDEEELEELAQASPALRWVKDDKALDLYIPNVDTEEFLQRSGLQLSMEKGGYVLSKRLSRVMRPYRYWNFFAADEITIAYNDQLDPAVWDGSGQVSRRFVQRMAANPSLTVRQRRELLNGRRFEVTTLHADGQDKGHVYVVDNLATDFIFPADSVKTELRLGETAFGQSVFVGLNPVHSDDQMCLDIQSLINLYPFFQPEQLLAWAGMESGLFLNGIRSGKLEGILNRLYDADSAAELADIADWHVGEYIASGGSLMWFAGMVKAVAKQHLNRLGSRADKFRAPVPGGRYYIFPASVGNREVAKGHICLDRKAATAWVNDADWSEYIVDVLGGCDGDDALWIFPFADRDENNAHKILAWRSPNQLGEYIVLKPTDDSDVIEWETAVSTQLSAGVSSVSYPKMESRLLPARVDRVTYQYGSLIEANGRFQTSPLRNAYRQTTPIRPYSITGMQPAIEQAAANKGVLGGFCNVTMLCKALYGRLPTKLPATLEDVIDGSVKTGLNLAPVRQWNEMALGRMVKHGQRDSKRAMPNALLPRLPIWLQEQAVLGNRDSEAHWLDTLVSAMEMHKAQYWAEAEALAAEACPPVELFENGRYWLSLGKELRQAYCGVIRQEMAFADEVGSEAMLSTSFDRAHDASETFLNQWPADKQNQILIGAAAYLYMQGSQNGEPVRDTLIWQLGRKREGGSGREAGIAQRTLSALRQIGLLGEPVWTETAGAVLHYGDVAEPKQAGVPITLNGVWLNLLNATGKETYNRMADVPPATRQEAKARIADYVQEKFKGMLLSTEVTEKNRVITRTPHGNLFGYVQRDHELAAVRYDAWRIAWATAVDGNVMAIMQPACAV